MEECSYVKVDGAVVIDAMKKLDELFHDAGSDYYNCICNPDEVNKNNFDTFFSSGAYCGAFEMAKLLFGPDFKITCDIANGGKLEHRLEVVDETDLR